MTTLLTLPRFNSFYLYFSSISHLVACVDLLNNPFCNDLSHNLSFGHLDTDPIINPNIEKLKKDNTLDTKCSETFDAFHIRKTTRMTVRQFRGKRYTIKCKLLDLNCSFNRRKLKDWTIIMAKMHIHLYRAHGILVLHNKLWQLICIQKKTSIF